MTSIALEPTQKPAQDKFQIKQLVPVKWVSAIIVFLLIGFSLDYYAVASSYPSVQSYADSISENAALAICEDDNSQPSSNDALTNNYVRNSHDVLVHIHNPPPVGIENAGDTNYVYITLEVQKTSYFNLLTNGSSTTFMATSMASCS